MRRLDFEWKLFAILVLSMTMLCGCSHINSGDELGNTKHSENMSGADSNTEAHTTEEDNSGCGTDGDSEPEVNESTEVHVHRYTESFEGATCVQEGKKIFLCDCGDSYYESVPALGHSFGEFVYNNDATFSKDGTKTARCENCGEEKTVVAEGTKRIYTYTLQTDPFKIYEMAVYKNSAKVYDEPSSEGKVIDTFKYKHLMLVVGECNETGWLKIIYDDEICAESNYENHLRVMYDYDSIRPPYDPDDTYPIYFSRVANNIKTGYINPKDVMAPEEWEWEIYHIWNGIKYYEFYTRSEGRNNYFKELCYAERYTIVEYDHMLGMLTQGSDRYANPYELFEKYANERGYLLRGGGGCWLDSKANAYYEYAEFLTIEEQYVETDFKGNSTSYAINWDYFERTYGYTEDSIWYVMGYISDKSIGQWDYENETVKYTLEEFAYILDQQLKEN